MVRNVSIAYKKYKKSLGIVTLYKLLDKSCYGRDIRDSKSESN